MIAASKYRVPAVAGLGLVLLTGALWLSSKLVGLRAAEAPNSKPQATATTSKSPRLLSEVSEVQRSERRRESAVSDELAVEEIAPVPESAEDEPALLPFGLKHDLSNIEELPDELRTQADFQLALLPHLASDDVAHNAWRAKREVESHSYRGQLQRPTVEALERALLSTDYQERQIAAMLLNSHWLDEREAGRLAEPSARHLRVCMEGLANDSWLKGGSPFVHNAEEHAGFLLHFPHRCAEQWRARLYASDEQERFHVAALLAFASSKTVKRNTSSPTGLLGTPVARDWIGSQTERVVQILSAHLADNQGAGDASLSAALLKDFVPQHLPLIRSYCTDEQSQAFLASLEGHGPQRFPIDRHTFLRWINQYTWSEYLRSRD